MIRPPHLLAAVFATLSAVGGCSDLEGRAKPADAPAAPARLDESVPVLTIEDAPGADPASEGRREATATATAYRLGVIGELEVIRFPGVGGPYVARIDTGANTSSVHAAEIEPFSRDGKHWVAFDLIGRDEQVPVRIEREVTRTVEIKSAGGPADERFVVSLQFRFGDETLSREFTLGDRTGMNYAVLIGRNVLDGVAVVDVSRAFLLEPPPSSGERD